LEWRCRVDNLRPCSDMEISATAIGSLPTSLVLPVTACIDDIRHSAAQLLQATQRGRASREALAEAAADEAMLADAMLHMATIEEARAAAEARACARSSLFALPMSMPEAARVLLTSGFVAVHKCWEAHEEATLTELYAPELRQPSLNPPLDDRLMASHDVYLLPDEACGTCVHRFRLARALQDRLLPILRTSTLQQRRQDPEGVQVSNVGGWHSAEVAFGRAADDENPPWVTELLPVLDAAVEFERPCFL
jgi:hypothetical protein